MKPSHLGPIVILALLILAHIAVNYFVVSQSSLLREEIDPFQINEALQFSRTIADQRSGGFFKAAMDAIRTNLHPHLYTFSLGALMSLDPPTGRKQLDLPIQCLNSVFLVILIYSVYATGNALFGRQEGLLAAALVSLSPSIFGPARLALIEVPLAALVSLTVFLLLKTRHLSLRGMSLLAGAAFGLAQLTKETALLFILPVAFFLSLAPASNGGARKQRTANLFIFLAAGILISAPVYLNPENFRMYEGIRWHVLNATDARPVSPLLYLEALIMFYLGWIAFIFTLPLLINYMAGIRKRNILPGIWIAVPLLAYVFCDIKSVRYLIPAVPALFLVISQEAFAPFFRKKKMIYPALLLLVFTAQYCLINFAYPKFHFGYEAYNDQAGGLLAVHREKDLLQAEKLVDLVIREAGGKKQLRIIAFPADTVFYDKFGYLFTLRGMDVTFYSLRTDKIPSFREWRRTILPADYLFDFAANPDKTRGLDKVFSPDYQRYKAVCLGLFELAEEFPMLDGNRIYVYKRRK